MTRSLIAPGCSFIVLLGRLTAILNPRLKDNTSRLRVIDEILLNANSYIFYLELVVMMLCIGIKDLERVYLVKSIFL